MRTEAEDRVQEKEETALGVDQRIFGWKIVNSMVRGGTREGLQQEGDITPVKEIVEDDIVKIFKRQGEKN